MRQTGRLQQHRTVPSSKTLEGNTSAGDTGLSTNDVHEITRVERLPIHEYHVPQCDRLQHVRRCCLLQPNHTAQVRHQADTRRSWQHQTTSLPSRLKLAAPENMLGLKAIAPQNMFRDATTTGLAPCTHEGRHLGCVRHGSVVHFDDDAAQSRCLKCPEMYRVLHQLILFMCNGPELICLRLHRCPPPHLPEHRRGAI